MAQNPDEIIVPNRGGFQINNFRAELNHNGVMRNNRFLMFFTPPKNMKNEPIEVDQSLLTLRCETVTVPGVNFFTNDNHRRYGLGQTERRPFIAQFNPITITFLVDRNARVVNYFNTWTNRIVGYDRLNGNFTKNDRNFRPYQLDYKDNYIAPNVIIWIYDENGIEDKSKQMGVRLNDVYPLATSDMNFSWADVDGLVRYNVTLQYTDMTLIFPHTDDALDLEQLQELERRSQFTRLGRAVKEKIAGGLLSIEEGIVNKITRNF